MDNKRQTIGIYFFIVIYSIWLTFVSLNKLTLYALYIDNTTVNIIRIICIFLLFIDEIIIGDRYSKKSVFGIFFILISGLVAFKSKDYYLIDIASLLFVGRNIPARLILKSSFFIQFIVMLITVIGAKTELLVNRIYFRSNGGIRNSLGYNYTSYISQVYMYMCLCLVAWKKEKVKISWSLVGIGIAYFLYKETYTRNPFIITIILFMYMILEKFIRFDITRNRLYKFFELFSIPLAAISAIYLALTFKFTQIYSTINWFLSSRLSLGHSAIQEFGIKWLGQPIEFTSVGESAGSIQGYNYVDSSYLQVLLVDGVLFSICVYIMFSCYTGLVIKKKNQYLVLCIVLIAIHSIVDPQLIYVWISPFFLLTGQVFNESFEPDIINESLENR